MNSIVALRHLRSFSTRVRRLPRSSTSSRTPSQLVTATWAENSSSPLSPRNYPCHNDVNNLQFVAFSTTSCDDSAAAATNPTDLSSLPLSQLQPLAMKYARQGSPTEAQAVLEHIIQERNTDENLSDLKTTIIDAWLQHQNRSIAALRESVASSDDLLRVQHNHLEDICHAAASASGLLENHLEAPSSHHYVAVLSAWANACQAAHGAGLTKKSKLVRGIPQRAQHLLLLQEEATSTKPTTESYNQVIKAWAYGGEHLRGTMAEQLFQMVKDPNGETYSLIIRAWCWSKERRCAFTATGHFMRMMRLLENGRSDMKLTLDDYHVLFDAWTRAEDKTAPSKVQTVLQIADNVFKEGLTNVVPDESCYRDALVTMSRRMNVPEVGHLADTTLAEMKDRMMTPDTTCYSAAILAWKHAATARECDDREKAVRRSLELLEEMTKAYHRTTKVIVKPTTKDYNNVLEALAISKSSKAAQHAETLLGSLEDALHSDHLISEESGEICKSKDENYGPSADTYQLVLNVWQNSKRATKVASALDVLERMKQRRNILKFSPDESFVQAFNSFIRVCAHSVIKDELAATKIMTMTLRTVDEMKSMGVDPDAGTYTALIETCDKLLPDGHERQQVLDNVFLRACEEGYVNQALLEQFKVAASTYLYAKLVVSNSREVENMKVVPESWTRNIREFSVNTHGGRKVLPLSIEGKFTFTKAAADYRMRKLRKRRNQRMLQGGRM